MSEQPRIHRTTKGATVFAPTGAPDDWRATCDARAYGRAHRKAIGRARYARRYARHSPRGAQRIPNHGRPLPQLMRYRAHMILGFVEYMKRVASTMFGAPGTWGHGRWPHATAKGPGRRRIPPEQQNHPPTSKLIKRFIRDARGEQVQYRRLFKQLTGKDVGV
jgi:hypothetical protein